MRAYENFGKKEVDGYNYLCEWGLIAGPKELECLVFPGNPTDKIKNTQEEPNILFNPDGLNAHCETCTCKMHDCKKDLLSTLNLTKKTDNISR